VWGPPKRILDKPKRRQKSINGFIIYLAEEFLAAGSTPTKQIDPHEWAHYSCLGGNAYLIQSFKQEYYLARGRIC
jgi:hypothetical protein